VAGPVAGGPRPPGRPRLEEPSGDYVARREEIIDVAARVFHARGFDRGTLEDVAEALGMRKPSLYYYVPSKGELLYLVFDRAITRALERLHHLSSAGDPRARLRALIEHQVFTITTEPSLFSVFFDQRPRLEDRYEDPIRAKEREYFRFYNSAVEEAVAAGAIPAVNSRYAAQAILGMAGWIYKWYRPERDDPERIARTFSLLVLGDDQ
jgi:TetR/AcrR family transcriptional regulator, cholesterol catabolism regulator